MRNNSFVSDEENRIKTEQAAFETVEFVAEQPGKLCACDACETRTS